LSFSGSQRASIVSDVGRAINSLATPARGIAAIERTFYKDSNR